MMIPKTMFLMRQIWHRCQQRLSRYPYRIPLRRLMRILSSLLVGFIVIFGLVQCYGRPRVDTLRVGMNNWIGYSLAIYAKETGIFAKRGLKVNLVRFNDLQDNMRATMRGSQDASFVALWETLQVDPANDKPVICLVVDISAGADGIVGKKGITSIKDLKGKRIGAKLGTVAHLILLEALKLHGLKPGDVQIEDVSNERSRELLSAGEIDAAVSWEPELETTAQKVDGKVIFTTKEIDSLVIDGLATRSAVLDTKRDAIYRFILGWFDAVHAVRTQPDQVFTFLAQELKQAKASVAADYGGLILGDIEMNRRMFSSGRLQQAIAESKQLLTSDPRHGRIVRQDVEIDAAVILNAINDWKP
jgi:NitT/TauT family transport system substrate-binding protein